MVKGTPSIHTWGACSNGRDLNRDFPEVLNQTSGERIPAPLPLRGSEQPETAAIMAWASSRSFVASASMHEVCRCDCLFTQSVLEDVGQHDDQMAANSLCGSLSQRSACVDDFAHVFRLQVLTSYEPSGMIRSTAMPVRSCGA